MPEKYEKIVNVEMRLTKIEHTLIRLYRRLPRHDRQYLRRVLVVMAKAGLRRQ